MTGLSIELREIVGDIISSVADRRCWEDVCDKITDRFGATGFMLFEYDLETHQSPRFSGSRRIREEVADYVKAFSEGDAEEDAASYERLARLPAGILVPEHEILELEHDLDMPPNAFREASMLAAGSKSRSAARINDIGPWMDVAALQMPIFAVDIPRQTFEEINFLLPLIGTAMESARIVSRLAGRFEMLMNAFDKLDFGLVFCSGAGQVILANRHFHDIALERDGVLVSGNTVSAHTFSDGIALQQMIASAASTEARPENLIMQVSRRSERRPMIAKAARVNLQDLGKNHSDTVMLLILDPEDETRIGISGIEAFGILSEAELEVCEMLLRGMPTDAIAEQRSTTLETTRSQIKSSRMKLSCLSRLDLLRLAIATSAPLKK